MTEFYWRQDGHELVINSPTAKPNSEKTGKRRCGAGLSPDTGDATRDFACRIMVRCLFTGTYLRGNPEKCRYSGNRDAGCAGTST